jgi:protein SCO1/2
VDSTVQYISKYHTIGDFSFVNQTEDHHQKDYEGKIYVADFSLPGAICPKMTANLFEVQKRLLIIQSDASFPYCFQK